MTPVDVSDQCPVSLERCATLHLLSNTPKGRGVFASQRISARTIIETCPVLILDPTDNKEHIEKTSLYHYTYNWPMMDTNDRITKTQAIVFGLGSMFNHSSRRQNVGWQRDVHNQLIVYRALRDIEPGEELCISYGDSLTFEDADGVDSAAPPETGEDVLNSIRLDV